MDTLSTADFGLVGFPLQHSFSKEFFTRLFGQEKSGSTYENFEIKDLSSEKLYELILMHPRLRGFNVTAPHKKTIMEFLDSMDDVAKMAGAVNTVKLVRDQYGRVIALHGFNTDVEGFRESISPLLVGIPQERRSALILGTGGASNAAAVALEQLGFSWIKVSRNPKQGQIAYSDIDKNMLISNPVIVNATPVGTFPNSDVCPEIPYHLLDNSNVCFDMVYNPPQTKFMALALAQGAKVKNGLEMLERQALAALAIWRGTKP